MLPVPRTLFLSLQSPAKFFASSQKWNIRGAFRVDGRAVEGNDTPWVGLADLLLSESDRCFAGLTFAIHDPMDQEQARRLADRLDPVVVRYNDMVDARNPVSYAHAGADTPHFEVSWVRSRQLKCELAQLLCGQWFWWYATEGGWVDGAPVIAIGITDVDELLNEHRLRFPNAVELPPLIVEWQ